MIRYSCFLSCLRSALVGGAADRDIVARLLLQQPDAAGGEPVFLDGTRVGKHYQVVSVRYVLFLYFFCHLQAKGCSKYLMWWHSEAEEYSNCLTCIAAVCPVSSAALPHMLSSNLTGSGTGVLCATSGGQSMNVTEIVRTHGSYFNHIIV